MSQPEQLLLEQPRTVGVRTGLMEGETDRMQFRRQWHPAMIADSADNADNAYNGSGRASC
ncbi:hypothetical protein [Streptomyces tritici]|uniref:hypothetical protein n=1 Tax=Streptomyces tritici TaxID=2054410 RepID=UPI003AEF5528